MGGDTSNTADASKTKNQKAKAKLKHVHNNPGQVQREIGRFKDIMQKNSDLEKTVQSLKDSVQHYQGLAEAAETAHKEDKVVTLTKIAEQNQKKWELYFCNVGAPSSVCWFMIPSDYGFLPTINHTVKFCLF